MKKLTFITCLVLLPLALQAQEDRYDQLTNPKLTSINKDAMMAHAIFLTCIHAVFAIL